MRKPDHESVDGELQLLMRQATEDIAFTALEKEQLASAAKAAQRKGWLERLADRLWNGSVELPITPAAIACCGGLFLLAGPTLQLLAVDSAQAALILSSTQSVSETIQQGVSSA